MKKILMSVLVIALVAVAVAGATGAWFSDTEESTGNTFTAGTMDLNIESGPGATSPVTFVDMAPGDVVSGTVAVKNIGSLNGTLYGRTTYVNADADPNPFGNCNLAEVLDVTSWQDPTMGPFNPGITIAQLVGQPHDVTIDSVDWMDYGTLATGATGTFDMQVTFNTGAGNCYQGDGIDVTFEFLLTQAGAVDP